MPRLLTHWALVPVLAVLALAAPPLLPSGASAAELPAARSARITAMVEEFRRANRIPGMSVAISIDGDTVYARGFGEARPGVAASERTIYPVGTITQQFTAGAILLLQERGFGVGRGKLAVGDPLTNFFRGMEFWRDANVEHLLTHTSGVPALSESIFYEQRLYSRIDQKQVLDFIRARDLDFEPGTRYRFSHSNYFLLAQIVEIGLDLYYYDYVETEIFRMLGMEDSTFLSRQPLGNRAQGHAGDNTPAPEVNPNLFLGSADATSTVLDLQKWNRELVRGKLFSADSRKVMLGRYVVDEQMRAFYGAGFHTRPGDFVEIFTIGELPGFTAINKILLRGGKDTYVTILTNKAGVRAIDALSSRLAAVAN